MYDTDQLMERICEEMRKISEKGLTTGNLDTAYKLVDMYKDLKNTEYWDTKGEYYMAVLDEMQGGYSQADHSMRGYSRKDGMSHNSMGGGYSERRHRDSMGRYSRADGYSMAGDHYDRYMYAKHSYRSGKSADSKREMMDTLDECMESITKKVEEMRRDADTPEEREMIDKYLRKLRNM